MATLKQNAMDFVSKQIKNIAELPRVSIELEVFENKEAEFPYKYVLYNDEEYKVPDSVLKDLKTLLEDNPELRWFKVKKSGEGLKTKYTTIPILTE